MSGLCAGVALAQIATCKHGVIGFVLDLSTWCHFDDFQCVVLVGRVLFTLHDQHVFEALVIFGTVLCRAVAQTVELEAFEGFCNGAWVERT